VSESSSVGVYCFCGFVKCEESVAWRCCCCGCFLLSGVQCYLKNRSERRALEFSLAQFIRPPSAPCQWQWFCLKVKDIVSRGFQLIRTLDLLSSLSVKRPIWGNSLNCSRQIIPEHSIRIIATWSCFTNRGRVFDLSPVFLSTKQMRA